jgi:hypothetical protein
MLSGLFSSFSDRKDYSTKAISDNARILKKSDLISFLLSPVKIEYTLIDKISRPQGNPVTSTVAHIQSFTKL